MGRRARTFLIGVGFLVTTGLVVAEEPPRAPPAGFQSLFNRRDLTGWEGNSAIWKVEGGSIVGAHQGLRNNEFLTSKATHRDFVLRARFRLKDGYGNSGIQFRSKRIPNDPEMIGYQADIGENYWGCLYDESRRNRVLVTPAARALERLNKADWNEYMIRCMDQRVETWLNDRQTVNYTEKEPTIALEGVLGLQVHGDAKPVHVEFRDIFFQELPIVKPWLAEASGFLHCTHKGADGKETKYAMFVPAAYHKSGDQKWPLIVFLHGAGERGADGSLPIKVGIGPALLRRKERFPFLVVFPQAAKTWDAASDDGNRALTTLAEVMRTYRVDPARVHLTGISMGGAGTWSLATAHPDRWASMSIVCGFGDASLAEKAARIPARIFLGDKDMPFIVDGTRNIRDELKRIAPDTLYTEYAGIGHNSWDLAYNTDDLYTWMRDRVKR